MPTHSRPRLVDAAFWCFVGGAVIMIVGGLLAATATYDAARAAIPSEMSDDRVRSYLTVYRLTGIGAVLAAGALAFLAGRARRGDGRFRFALLGMAFALVAVVLLMATRVGVAQPLILLGLLPVLVGAALMTRPAARAWYDQVGGGVA
jgi:NAD/NADP transhydrogenase beta subunit